MSWQRSYWFRVPLSKQLKWETVGQVEAAINNVTIVFHRSHLVSVPGCEFFKFIHDSSGYRIYTQRLLLNFSRQGKYGTTTSLMLITSD